MLSIAQLQKLNRGYCAFIDAEHSLDFDLARSYGVDLDSLIYVNPGNAEKAFDTMEALIRSEEVRLIVIDSVSALTPSFVMESSAEQQTMALLARFLSSQMGKVCNLAYNYKCTVLFLNQIRTKVGAYSAHGTPSTTSGGNTLPFYSSVRLNVQSGDQLKDGNNVVGAETKVKVIKNKLAIPFKEATFNLYYGKGVDRYDEVSQLAIFADIVHQGGAWFSYLDSDGNVVERDGVVYKWQGRAKFAQFLHDNPAFFQEIEDVLRGKTPEAPDTEKVADVDGYQDDGGNEYPEESIKEEAQ